MPTSVLIVDDHAGYRRSLAALLDAEGFRVVGEAGDAASALEAAQRLRPQLALVDVQLPGGDGFGVAERLAEADGALAVVLISSREASAYGGRLAETPARGFLAKRELTGAALRLLVGA